jgi:hypothetical protein
MKTFQSFYFKRTWWRLSNLLILVYLMKTFQSFDFECTWWRPSNLLTFSSSTLKSKDWKVFIKYTQSQKTGRSSSSTLKVKRLEGLHQVHSKSKDWKVFIKYLSNLLTLSVLDKDFPVFWLWVYLMKTFQSFYFKRTWWRLSNLLILV